MTKIVLITGCSSGIGMEAALAFARAGDVVYASMRDLSRADALNSAARAEGLSIDPIELDVTRPETFAPAIDRIDKLEGRLDVLVNNAGMLPVGAFEDVSAAELRRVMETNFFGPALLTQAVLPIMRREREGYIIMISSLSGIASKSGDAAYAASKFAVEGLTEGFRHEIGRWNIKSALVEPGQYATNIFQGALGEAGSASSPYAAYNNWLHEMMAKDAGCGEPPRKLAELLVEISRSDGSRLRWPADKTAEFVMTSVFAQNDEQRDKFLRKVSGIDWWVSGADAPDKEGA